MTFFAGTFVRHPLALAAARAVLLRLKEEGPELQRGLNLRTTTFVESLAQCGDGLGAPVQINHFSSWFFFNFPHDLPLAASVLHLHAREGRAHLGRAGRAFSRCAQRRGPRACVDRVQGDARGDAGGDFLPEA